ncbi:MAG: hypothetical protein WD492_06980 [Alkalispirochaeta sp.]
MNSLRRINFQSGQTKIDPATIPDLVPTDVLKSWTGDSAHVAAQMIEYPVTANNVVYDESFFDSYVAKLSKAPIPGSKTGHTVSESTRPPTDFVMSGARIEKTGNGAGRVFFKMVVPKTADTDNAGFIRELQSGMVNFSLVSYVREERNADGNIHVIESVRGERNDAVQAGMGAMKQVVNQDTGEREPDPGYQVWSDRFGMVASAHLSVLEDVERRAEHGDSFELDGVPAGADALEIHTY